jgi:hypothetical protein
MKLKNPTDDELNAAFAEKVAGWRCYKEQRGEYALAVCYEANERDPWEHWDKKKEAQSKTKYTSISCADAVKIGFFGRGLPRFTTSADAVLPWLDNPKSIAWWEARLRLNGKHQVICHQSEIDAYPAEADTFPRAAVIALLRAHGVEITYGDTAASSSPKTSTGC